MKNYTVQEGDTPQGLASLFGFKNWKNIYEHKSNAALRGKRGPNELVPGDTVNIPDAFSELPSGSSSTLIASNKLPLPPVIFDAHMHIMSGNCTPFPVAYYTQIESRPVIGGLLSPGSSRKMLNKVGKAASIFMPFLGWSPRSTLVIGEDTVDQNDSVYSVFRKADSTPELRDCRASFLGISIVLTMDMDLCHLDGYKGQDVYMKQTLPGVKKPVYTYNIRLTGEPNERRDEGRAHASEVGLFETWKHQLLNTKTAAAEHPFRLIPMYHYEPRRYSQWTGKESRFTEASLASNWAQPFAEVATKTQAGIFAGFKMYTPQGYQPTDPNVPSLAKFFEKCAEAKDGGIPIMTHCTPAGHFTHDRKLYIDLDPAAKSQLSKADEEAYEKAKTKRDKYLDAKAEFTNAEKTFEDYCQRHNLPLDPYVYQSGILAPEMTAALPADPAYWKAYSAYQDALSTLDETGEEYERAARDVRKHEDIAARYKRAGENLQKMAQDPPLRLKYFKEKFLHPEAWRPLLKRHKNLRLCLAHFASDACLWWHYLKDENGKCWDLDDVPYDINWVTSIVDLCKTYDNFYTDISYLPLMEPLMPTPGRSKEEKKQLKQKEKDGALPLHWEGLAKVCENKHMLKKIMFGTDWYMILASSKGYAKWHKETLEGLALIEKRLKARGKMPREINLFYQFAVVNPMRFYRMPLIVDNLKAGIEAYVGSAPLSEKEKEKYFAKTKQRMARNYPLLKNLAAVLQTVENEPNEEERGLLYTDMLRFVNLVPTS